MIEAHHISYSVQRKQLLHDVTMHAPSSSFTVIMGPNGAGKSTLLKILAGSLKANEGTVHLNEKPLTAYTSNDLAKTRAVLSQHYHLNFPLSVKEIVMMGRYPYFTGKPSLHDTEWVKQAMSKMEVEAFAERDYNSLSGGEAQKVQMSRVLTQIGDTANHRKTLFLDEPISHLDMKYQHQLLLTAKELTQKNVTVCAVLHDINLALQYADRILFMRNGKILFNLENPSQITAEIIQVVFDLPCRVLRDNDGVYVVPAS